MNPPEPIPSPQPPGQTRTERPAGAPDMGPQAMISSARDVEQGARSMLILAEGLFRLDVIPHDDTVQTILRNLSSEPEIELRLSSVGGANYLSEGSQEVVAPSTTRFGGEVVLIGSDGTERPVAKLLVGSICHLERGLTSFTAQATLHQA
jgi:hypothetical protein